ncbi:MAG: hypothetical protein K0Q79_3044 [Flavipsychrobacter sp.]|jgi:hypothetical protein|nr:hypothetical protein [Flavipsychrobacter sp.]
MRKNYLSILLAMTCLAGSSYAQKHVCGTDEVYRELKSAHPEVAVYEKRLEESIKNYISYKHFKGARTTATTADTNFFIIPVVVHVVHNYGSEQLSDNKIYEMIKELNTFYTAKNNLSTVIQPFKKYIGNARIRFVLAGTDPAGNPTNGIVRHHSYLTYGYDDQAKLDQWPSESYYNIWFEEHIGRKPPSGVILAYSTFPASAVATPFYDGVISGYNYIDDGTTMPHETGHYLNLMHPWNSSGKEVGEACGDDGVDDTPPTKGHFSTCPLYDTACAINYFKIYPTDSSFLLVNYPDTANTQNIMDYSNCTNMLTIGQVERMKATLESSVAFRSTLCDSINLASTGIGTLDRATKIFTPFARKDLKPRPAFAAMLTPATGSINKQNYMDRNYYFCFPGVDVKFVNESWNDTVTSITWTFSNSATVTTTTQPNPVMGTASVVNKFNDPGWVTLSLKATGNGSGDTTATWNRAVFVADATGTPGIGYFQEFSTADTAKWPMFNYYNNNLKWKIANVGYHDNQCMQYVGYDDRSLQITGNPRGDYDDMFSIPMDLSGYSGPCSMNFYYSGASRSASSINITDTLLIQYSVGKSNAWTTLATLAKGALCNVGAVADAFVPTSKDDWELFSMNVPAAARTNYTVFRFRYKPGTSLTYDGTTYVPGWQSSGNNFYMDRVTFSPYPAGFNNLNLANGQVAVMPNPTSGNAYIVVKDAATGFADVSVTDITGKVVYTTSQPLNVSQTTIEIPQTAISVSGMYLVHVVTGNNVNTVKLVVQ